MLLVIRFRLVFDSLGVQVGYNNQVMSKIKDGMRVRVKAREATAEEAKNGRYAPYLGNVTGTVLKVYSAKEIAVNLDTDSLHPDIIARHKKQQQAMHQKWLDSLSEEARNRLTPEEKAFRLNYVVLLAESDLTTGKAAEKPVQKQAKASEPKPELSPAKASAAPMDKRSQPESRTPDKAAKANGKAAVSMEKQAAAPGKTVKESEKQAKSETARTKTAPPKSAAPSPTTQAKSQKTTAASPKAQAESPKSEMKTTRQSKPADKTVKDVPAPKRPTLADLEAQEEQYLKSKRKRT